MHHKIVIIKSQKSSYYGGREKQLLTLIKAWQEYEKEILFYSDCPILTEKLKKHHIPLKKIWLAYEPVGLLKSLIFLLVFPFLFIISIFFLIYLKLTKKIKILYFVNIPEKIIMTLPARLLGFTVIWEEFQIKDNWSAFNPFRWLWIILSKMAKIITYSNAASFELTRKGISRRQINIVYPGITLKEFQNQESILNALQETNTQNKIFKIGTLCHLSKKNGLEYLLQALKIIIELIPEAQLVIIGTGEERFNLNWLVRKLGIEKHIWFMGYQDDYNHWLKTFDLFVLPAVKNDGLNLAIIEAMANFCPVVASNLKSFDEIVKHNFSGVLVNPGEPETIAQTIIYLYRNQTQRKEMGQNAYQRAKAVFNIDRVIEDMERIIA